MLTADLALSWQRGAQIKPRYINAEDEGWLDAATALVELFREHQGCTRAELEAALEEYVGAGTDYKILRGLIKLLLDRTEFAAGVEVVPADLRRAVFLKARAAHPVTDESGRVQVLTEAGEELGCAPELVRANLYADLPKNQRLVEFEEMDARALLELYNVAQAQALLYRCVRMRLTIEPQGAEGYRELFGAIKAYRLIHTIKGSPAEGYEIELDGPVSMFHRSQKYGIQMAVFLPALLLCKGWRMRAEIESRHSGTSFFEMTSGGHALSSHYLSVVPYENPVREKLLQSWARFESEWKLETSTEIINLGASAFIPDFALRHERAGHVVYLEILGFWTPPHLQERLREFAGSGFRNFLLAAWEELRGSREPLVTAPPHAIIFKRSLDPATVELAANKLISEAGQPENI
jgi:predicted nuclease of restriction endonuclease-like RecB superfamily